MPHEFFARCHLYLDHSPACCCSGSFNHSHAAATEHAPPLPPGPIADGWVLDHNRVQVLSALLYLRNLILAILPPACHCDSVCKLDPGGGWPAAFR